MEAIVSPLYDCSLHDCSLKILAHVHGRLFARAEAVRCWALGLRNDLRVKVKSRAFGHIAAETLCEWGGIISEDLRTIAVARDRNVGQPIVDQIGMGVLVDVDPRDILGEPLGAVTGNRSAMVEVPHLGRIELGQPALLRPDRERAILGESLDGGKIAGRDLLLFERRRELGAIALCKVLLNRLIGADAAQPSRVIADTLPSTLSTVRTLRCESIAFTVEYSPAVMPSGLLPFP